jgi:hypothetical protein
VRTELALGDSVSGEERYIVLALEVLPLPLLPDGSLPTSLEGEELIGLEFANTSLTEEGTDLRLESRTSAHLVRIQGTQNPAEVIQNVQLIAVIANQQTADAMRKAGDELANGADAEAALQKFTSAKLFLVLALHRSWHLRRLRQLDEHERTSGLGKPAHARVRTCYTKRATTDRPAAPGCTPARVRDPDLPKNGPPMSN